jgi:hypothetical protein
MYKRGAVALLLIVSSGTFSQTHQHGSTSTGDGEFNPFVAADERGGFFVAYIARKDSVCNVMLKHSKDGTRFSEPVRVNDRPGDAAVRNENPPKVAVSGEGDVYVCWASERERWKGDIKFARSSDGGRNFSPAVTLNSDAGRGPATGHAFQSVAVDRNGRIYAAWIDERNKKPVDRGAEIWLSVSDDGGKSFSPDRRILSDVCECCRTNIQIAGDGSLLLSYRTVPAAGPMLRDIMVARSTDRGRSFAAARVSEDGWAVDGCPVTGPALCVLQSQVTVVWFVGGGGRPGLYYASSNDNGRSFSKRMLLDEEQKMGRHAQACLAPDGRIAVAWDDAIDGVTSFFGVLDPAGGHLSRSPVQQGVSHPTLASNGQIAVVAGMKSSSREVAIVSYPMPRLR